MSDETSFGRWLQRRRKALDLTPEALAQRVGCAAETLRKIEADARRPSRQIAERLAEALELPPEERVAFVKAARADFAVDRLLPPTQNVSQITFVPAETLPQGTVTFLFTDIEGSTKLWEQYRPAMAEALARHDAILRQAITTQGGVVFKSTGDGFAAAFPRATDALNAALAAQRTLANEDGGRIGGLRVRMALHTGIAESRDGDYFGPPLNRVARLLAVGHGGQVLLSLATAELVRDALPTEVTLRELGAYRLKDLTRPEQIFQALAPDLPVDFPPLRAPDHYRHNLPVQPTPLIGREADVARLCDLLRRSETRLVTLSGPGGIGKTRLAIQAAAELLDQFAHGVAFVNLAPLSDPALVEPTIAQTLGVTESPGRPLAEGLKAYLRDKQTLLLLDNFEQVVAAAPLVGNLLAAVPRLKILVTSREVLHLRGEKEFAVPPLNLPDPKQPPLLEALSQYAAVQLFIARALDVKPDFALTNANATAVARICHRLDGLPLAIELAATRVKLFPPQALLARLEQPLALLTGGPRDLPARQQTLRNTIAWSYNLLDTSEQTLFRRLAMFVGSCNAEAVESVCNAAGDLGVGVLDGLAALIDKSLLRQEEQGGDEPRFRMLETIREYGLERLEGSGELEVMRRQHATYFLGLAEQAEPHLRRPEQLEWLARLTTEHDNLRAALAWSQEAGGDIQIGLRLAGALWWFWQLRGHQNEGRRWLKGILARPEAAQPTVARAKALHVAAYMAPVVDTALAEESLRLARQLGAKEICALVLNPLGYFAYRRGDDARGVAMLEESLALCQELGNLWGAAESLRDLAEIAADWGDFQRATALLEESLALSEELVDKRGSAEGLCDLGHIVRRGGDLVRATTLFEQSLALARELEDKDVSARALRGLGIVALDQADATRAIALFEESLALARECENVWGMINALSGMGDAALKQGDIPRALSRYQETLSLCRALEDQSAIAWALHGLGRVVGMQGDTTDATALFAEGLTLFRNWGDMEGITRCLDALAGIVGAQGQPERAVRLVAAAEALRDARGTQLSAEYRAEWQRLVAGVRSQLDEATFAAAWAEGRAMTLEQAIAEAIDPS